MADGGGLDADLIARAIVAAARSYGDDPVEACAAKWNNGRRALTAAAAGLVDAGAGTAKRVQAVLGISGNCVYSARNRKARAFRRAAAAVEDVVRLALRERAIRAAAEANAVRLPATGGPVRTPDLALVGERALEQERPSPIKAANGVRVPVRSPYSPEHPKPAPVPPPRPVPRERKAPRGATVRSLGEGVEVIRLKPITDKVLAHARAQIERGLDVGEAAEFFEVDADQLADRLKAAGVRL